MADLIDRAALIEMFTPLFYNASDIEAEAVIEKIKIVPVVDAVEVVRCEKCIWRTTWIKSADYAADICGMSGMFPRGETDYCGYGERRTDATD